MSEWTIGAVLDAIADAIPGSSMTICGRLGDGKRDYQRAKSIAPQKVAV
jgi:hypothetical protein